MKKAMTILMVLTVICLTVLSANADVWVSGYTRSNGTYVQPHYRSNPDGNFYNNWSTYPNTNPYTGAVGTRHTPSYSDGYSSRTPSYTIPSYPRGSKLTPPCSMLSPGSSSLNGRSSSRGSSLWSE